MDSNTHSTDQSGPRPPGPPDSLAGLVAAVDALAAQDLDRLADAALAEDLLGMRRLLDGLEGQWLRRLAAVDARGAAGADQGQDAPSTASWLRTRRRLSVDAAHSSVRTARALFGGSLPETAAALCAGEISPAHAKAVAGGTRELADHVKLEAEPVLVEAARRVDPPRLRRAVEHLVLVADPDAADRAGQHRHERRGVWLSPTWQGMVAVDGLLEAEAGATLLAALEPLARPADAGDDRTGRQRNADSLVELARRSLEGGWLPKAGGVRPQLLVTVDLDSLLGRPHGLGGETGWAGPLDSEACRRLACDGAVTRLLVSRHPSGPGQADRCHGEQEAGATRDLHQDTDATQDRNQAAEASGDPRTVADGPANLAAWLRAAVAKLPRPWVAPPPAPGGRPFHPGGAAGPARRPGRARRRLCLPGL
jgi:hypothetical protein